MEQPELTSAEVANLWASYLSESMTIRVLYYFLVHVEQEDIRGIVESALELSENRLQTITNIFMHEKAYLPLGFTDKDINLKAPRLYTDKFLLHYVHHLASLAMKTYTLSLAQSVRPDLRAFYLESQASQADLFNRTTELLVQKGLIVQSPSIPLPEKVDIVHKKSFLSGWFSDRRPLTAIEVKDIFFNMQRNTLGRSLLLGFTQVAQNEKVRDYMARGVEIASKHAEIFGSILDEEHLPSPAIYDDQVTKSTISPFTDKLMMFHTTALITSSIGYYGMAMGMSPRRDLALHYSRLIAEIGKFSIDGAKISIQFGWLEQPPTSPDRKALSKV